MPQRRRRIALVADFGGHAAPEILFVRKGMCGDTAAGGTAREETAAGFGSGAYPAIARSLTARYDGSPCIDRGPDIAWCLQGNGIDRADTAGCNGCGWKADVSYPLNTIDRHAVCAGFKHNAGAKAGSIGYEAEIAPTLNAGQTTAVYDARGNGDGKTVCTLTRDHQSRVTDYTAIVMATGQAGAEITRDIAPTLNCNHEQPVVAGVDCRNGTESEGISATLQTHNSGGFSLNCTHPVRIGGIVRRLTPLECERLQG